jgi:HPt (histidine-containing phosphotransfer) domain-containing protein
MSTTNEPAFDWSQAASLLGDDPNAVDPEMAGIVRELVDGAEVQFAEMREKNADTDRKTVSSLAHALRGCLLNFGFTEVGTILMDVEKGPPFTNDEYKEKLERAYQTFLASKKLLAAKYPCVGIV